MAKAKLDRGELQRQAQTAFRADAQRHTFQYWLVLGTRNLRVKGHSAPTPTRSRTIRPEPVQLPDDKSAWTWREHFLAESDPTHGRAESRRMPKYSRRSYRYWSAEELQDIHLPRFLRQVAKANQGPISYGFWIEQGKHNKRPHAHVHLGGIARVSLTTLENIWKGMNGGRAVVRIFKPNPNDDYAYKHVAKPQVDFDGREHELLWRANYWKPDRTHNTPEQARLFKQAQARLSEGRAEPGLQPRRNASHVDEGQLPHDRSVVRALEDFRHGSHPQ